jgi:hypothetical protein
MPSTNQVAAQERFAGFVTRLRDWRTIKVSKIPNSETADLSAHIHATVNGIIAIYCGAAWKSRMS